MQHFPIFMAVAGRRIVLAGGGEAAQAKLRIILKTEANVTVIDPFVCDEIRALAQAGKITLIEREMEPGDATCAVLFYAATEDDAKDRRVAALARADGAITNLVDNLEDSQFITPAIVDRDPVTVAIGTEGAAPVVARAIKRDIEERLPQQLGTLARIGKTFRKAVEILPLGRKRRDFWNAYYFDKGPRLLEQHGEDAIVPALQDLLEDHRTASDKRGFVSFVGAGPGDPDLLTLKARKVLHDADVVIYDQLVSAPILDLARREAVMINVGKTGFGKHTPQTEISALLSGHALAGAKVVRLKSGDPTVYGRLEEEILVCEKAGVAFNVVPGITAASAAAASIGQSLTARGRNSEMRLLTGHDIKGFADQDWLALTRPGAVAAFYMAKQAARFVQGRLLMHGADPDTPVTIVENVSRPNERVIPTTLGQLEPDLTTAKLTGPAVIMFGLSTRSALEASTQFEEAL